MSTSPNPSFGSSEVEFLDSPLGLVAVRPGLCWCEECSRKNAKGFGATKEEAVADLIEEEAERNGI